MDQRIADKEGQHGGGGEEDSEWDEGEFWLLLPHLAEDPDGGIDGA